MDLPRRAVLRQAIPAAGLGWVAGCAGGPPGDGANGTGTTEPDPTPTTDPDPPEDAIRRVTVRSVSERPDVTGVEVRVEVFERFATPDQPPAVEVIVENTGDRPVELRGYQTALVWPRESQSGAPGLYLGPIGAPRDGGRTCWRAKDTATARPTPRSAVLEPGASESVLLAVLGDPGNTDACLPTGTYRFVDDYPSVCFDGDCRDWTVAFSLRVTDPG